MTGLITPKIESFLHEPVLIHIATVMKDGSPQATPVWVDSDGQHIIINTAEGRQEVRNIRRDPRVAFTMADPKNQYRLIYGRGGVVNVTADGARDHINHLSQRYTNRPYPVRDGDNRLKVFIEPGSLTSRELS